MPATLPAVGWRRKLVLDLIVQVGGFGTAAIALIWFKKEPVSFVIPAVLGCWALYWIFKFKGLVLTPLRRERERNRAANQRLAQFRNAVNVAKTVRVQPVEAATVVEVLHDEGAIYLFDLGDNRTYWIDPYCEMIPGRPLPEDWPNSQFEVFKIAGWKDHLGPFCFGKRLRPKETLEFRDLFEHYDFEPPEDGVIDQPLDAFLRDVERHNRSAAGASAT